MVAEAIADTKQNTGQQYKITNAIITADRLGDLEIEVTKQIAELNVFEHLEKPYLTGLVMIVDDGGIFGNIKFKGTERFSFEVSSVDEGLNIGFEHTFIMRAIEKVERTTDKTEVYLISLIDEHAFKDAAIRFSKSYNGKLENIATGILVSELDKSVDISYAATGSSQPPMRVIVPYLSPLNASKWLLNRASTANGAPFFIYASMYDSNIRIGDYETMMAQDAFNSKLPYIYSAASTSDIVNLSEDKKAFMVESIKREHQEETMKMTFDGAIGAQMTTQDVSGNKLITGHHAVSKTLEQLEANEVIPFGSEQQVYDPEYIVFDDEENPVLLDDLSARYFHTISSYGTYGTNRSYHDAFNEEESIRRIKSISIRSMIERNKMEISIPGTGLFVRNVTVGDTMEVNFLNSNVNIDDEDTGEKFDKSKSGKYLIYSVRHTFKGRKHDAVVSITKISSKKNIPV